MEIVVVAISVIGILIGWFNYLKNQRFRIAVQAKTERFNKIIDRFSTEKELLEFLKSDKGVAVLNTLVSTGTDTKIPILVTASSGIVAIFVGIGAAYIAGSYEDDLIFAAVFMSAIGFGLLTAAAFSYFIGKRWGLFKEENPLISSDDLQSS